jgi:hypothetical protein
MFSSEQQFRVNGEDKTMLTKALQLALDLSNSKIEGYRIIDQAIYFYWHSDKENVNKLPKTNNIDTLVNIAWDHLSSEEAKTAHTKNSPQDDIDGSISRGWEIFIPSYDELDDDFYVVVGIRLDWLYFHK